VPLKVGCTRLLIGEHVRELNVSSYSGEKPLQLHRSLKRRSKSARLNVDYTRLLVGEHVRELNTSGYSGEKPLEMRRNLGEDQGLRG
jgi:hypothetical protein